MLSVRFRSSRTLRYLLSVGTIEQRKNHQLVLKAFERLDAPDAGLVIVGPKRVGVGRVPRRLRKPQGLWQAAVLAYRPFHYEGYGLPAVEA
jgi:glycosyltransferase involved in cell wall biosynthesis